MACSPNPCSGCLHKEESEAWGPPQFQEKRSRSEKAILGALGEFLGILGAALGIRNSILGIRSSILGMASHDLSNTKTTILGATPGAIPGIGGNPHETGNAKLSTTTAREQNRALGPQIYGRYPNAGKHRKSISTIALAGSAKIWVPQWW